MTNVVAADATGSASERSSAGGASDAVGVADAEPGIAGRSLALGWRRVAILAIKVAFTGAIVGAIVLSTVRLWPQVRETITSLAWPAVALSLLLVLLGLAAQTMSFRAALRDLGHRVTVRTSGQIYLIGLLAKYLPGTVWTFVLQMELGRRANLPRSRAFLASMVCLSLSTTAALALGAAGLPALFEIDPLISAVVLLIVPVALVCAHPRVLTALIQRFLALARRPGLTAPITWRGVGVILGWSTVAWVCFGGHLWLLAASEANPGAAGIMRCVAAFALGLTAGMVAVLSPSGLGVREAIITAALLPYVPAGVALGMALASRLIFTVGDVLAAGIAALAGVRLSRAVRPGVIGSATELGNGPTVPAGEASEG